MKPGGGAHKGSAFERLVAKQLSLWWTAGKDRNALYRTHGSGNLRKGSTHSGDIGPLNVSGNRFPFHIECKHYSSLNWNSLIQTPSQFLLVKWMSKALRERNPSLAPLLVVKCNYIAPIVVAPTSGAVCASTLCPLDWHQLILDEAVQLHIPNDAGLMWIPFSRLLEIPPPYTLKGHP